MKLLLLILMPFLFVASVFAQSSTDEWSAEYLEFVDSVSSFLAQDGAGLSDQESELIEAMKRVDFKQPEELLAFYDEQARSAEAWQSRALWRYRAVLIMKHLEAISHNLDLLKQLSLDDYIQLLEVRESFPTEMGGEIAVWMVRGEPVYSEDQAWETWSKLFQQAVNSASNAKEFLDVASSEAPSSAAPGNFWQNLRRERIRENLDLLARFDLNSSAQNRLVGLLGNLNSSELRAIAEPALNRISALDSELGQDLSSILFQRNWGVISHSRFTFLMLQLTRTQFSTPTQWSVFYFQRMGEAKQIIDTIPDLDDEAKAELGDQIFDLIERHLVASLPPQLKAEASGADLRLALVALMNGADLLNIDDLVYFSDSQALGLIIKNLSARGPEAMDDIIQVLRFDLESANPTKDPGDAELIKQAQEMKQSALIRYNDQLGALKPNYRQMVELVAHFVDPSQHDDLRKEAKDIEEELPESSDLEKFDRFVETALVGSGPRFGFAALEYASELGAAYKKSRFSKSSASGLVEALLQRCGFRTAYEAKR